MKEELLYILNTSVAIFVIVDPFAMVPVYLTLTERFTREDRRATRRKATFIALAILFSFTISGSRIFKFFGITMPAFQIAGGILLLTFGLSQLNRKRKRLEDREEEEGMSKDDISIFPLATPLLAGPGAISTVVLFSSNSPSTLRVGGLMVSVLIVMSAAYFILKVAPTVYRILGRTGLNVVTRIMGIIVTAIAVQFIINGVKGAFNL